VVADDRADIGIITILEEEYHAVADLLDNLSNVVPSDGDPNLQAWRRTGISSAAGGPPRSVVLAKATGPGTNDAAIAARRIVERFEVETLFIVGIAGGIESNGVNVGDIVIANSIWFYEYGKIKDGFSPRHDMHFRPDGPLLTAASAYSRSREFLGLDASRLPGRPASSISRPEVVIGPVASGDKVIDKLTDSFAQRIIQADSRTVAVEMEAGGAANAVKSLQEEGRTVRLLMVRGISDTPSESQSLSQHETHAADSDDAKVKQRDDWKECAARTAALFAIEFIKSSYWPLASKRRILSRRTGLLAFAILACIALFFVRLKSRQDCSPRLGKGFAIDATSPSETSSAVVKTTTTSPSTATEERAETLLQAGISVQLTGDYKRAIALYDEAASLVQPWPALLTNRGLAKFLLKRYDEARFDLSRAVQADPSNVYAWFNLGQVLEFKNEPHSAIKHYTQAIALKSDFPDAYYRRSIQYSKVSSFDSAIRDLDMVIALRPDDFWAHFLRGKSLMDARQFQAALTDFIVARNLKPTDAHVSSNISWCLTELGLIDQAIQAANDALIIFPEHSAALNNLGLAYERSGRLEQAIVSYTKAIDCVEAFNRRYDPDRIDSVFLSKMFLNRGRLLMQVKQVNEAINTFKQACSNDPSFWETWAHLAWAYACVGDKEHCVEALQHVDRSNVAIERWIANCPEVSAILSSNPGARPTK